MPQPTPRRGLPGLLDVFAPRDARRWSLAPHVGLLFLADMAILVAVETAVSSLGGEASQAREVVLMGLGIVVAGWEFRRLQDLAGVRFRGMISATWTRLFDKLDELDLLSFERLGPDAVHRRLALEAAQVSEGGVVLVSTLRYGVRALAALLYLLWLAPQMAFVVLVGLGLVGLLRAAGGATMELGMVAAMGIRDRLQGTIRALTRGFAQVQLHVPRGDALMQDVEAQAAALGEQQKAVQIAFQHLEAIASAALYGIIAVVGVGVGAMDPSLGARLLVAVFFVLRATNQLTFRVPMLYETSVALDALRDLEDEIDAALARLPWFPDAPPIESFERLGLRGVRFRYDEGAFTFGPVDLELRRGEVLFITGHNGSGKSTCLKLLLGLYPPALGELVLDGRPQPARPPQAWRDLFSVVLSEFVLFDRLLGMEQEVSEARAQELLGYVGLEHVVRIEGGRFSTVDLSTGQRKRLALVIALLQDRPVFVFDEWAADQDPHFRDAFYNRVLPDLKRRGKAVICVTHDDAFFHLADREVVFAEGRVVS
ncbi:MAG: ATP-binding cassette domain-containing protein [Alphaproteobacteria bacterium]|nr:ATP-binding cassette domain-containing protein [Alphaproteobacteria bacterium]